MKTTFRYAVMACAVTCALVALASIAFWVRSYWACDLFTVEREWSESGISILKSDQIAFPRGRVNYWRVVQTDPLPYGGVIQYSRSFHHSHGPPRPTGGLRNTWLQRLGFYWGTYSRKQPVGTWWNGGVWAPLWFTTLAFGSIPTFYARRRWLRPAAKAARRRARGLCGVCGYDVRASTHRCPECGSEISTPAINSALADAT